MTTTHFLLCDIDLWPDVSLYPRLRELAADPGRDSRAGGRTRGLSQRERSAIVRFEKEHPRFKEPDARRPLVQR